MKKENIKKKESVFNDGQEHPVKPDGKKNVSERTRYTRLPRPFVSEAHHVTETSS